MKKKIFALITALLIVCSLCLALVACDDNEGNSPKAIRFTENMSKEEIIEKLDDITNFTVELYYGDDYAAYYFGKDWAHMESNDGEENGAAYKHWMFIKDGRVYVLTMFCEENDEWDVDECFAIDDDEEIAEYSEDIAQLRDYYREQFINKVNAGEYTIVDGGIKVAADNGEGYIILRNVNSTKMPSLPEEYKDYKNFELTTDEDVE